MIFKSAETELETHFGTCRFLVYQEKKIGKEHVVLVKPWGKRVPIVRIHSECTTGDLFGSVFCDCQGQLHKALRIIARHGGALIYLRQEGRGIGLTNKIKAYELQQKGLDTVEANRQLGRKDDERSYEIAEEILNNLKIKKFQLLTNNPEKMRALKNHGFEVERVPLLISLKSSRGKKYLTTKQEKLGHLK